MKILLLGDFSSSMRFLKKGLEENGCKVDHFALQNGWRNNPVSNQLNSKKKSMFLSRFETYQNCLRLKKLRGYEILVLNSFFPLPKLINRMIIEEISEHCNQTILWITGCDSQTYKVFEDIYPDLCGNCLRDDQKRDACIHDKEKNKENSIGKFINRYVPSSVEYYNSYVKKSNIKDKLTNIVPLAIDITDPELLRIKDEKKGSTQGKHILMHSMSREGMKGSYIFQEGYHIFEKRIFKKNNIQFNKFNRIPFSQYVQEIRNADVNFDQLHNRSLGITSLLTMSLGTLLIAGDTSEFAKKASIPDAPYLPIKERNANGISELLFKLNNSTKKEITNLGLKSQEYVNEYHCPRRIGKMFLEEIQII